MSNEWVSAADAVAMLKQVLSQSDARSAIVRRCVDGSVCAIASRYTEETDGRLSEPRHDVSLPREFWSAFNHKQVSQDWLLGDFESKGGFLGDVKLRASGVLFSRGGVEAISPRQSQRQYVSERTDKHFSSNFAHLSPYLRLMLTVVQRLQITPEHQPKKEEVMAELKASWTEASPLSSNLLDAMGTLIREPASQGGRNPKLRSPER